MKDKEKAMKGKEKVAISVAETAARLSVSPNQVYQHLIHRADFPSFNIGGRWLVSVAGLEQWVLSQSKKGGYCEES